MTDESRRLLSLFQFCFYWMCEFQVSRIFDVSSSLEKRLDKMVVLVLVLVLKKDDLFIKRMLAPKGIRIPGP